MISVYFSWLEQSWRLIHPPILGPGRDTNSDKASPTTVNPLLVLLNFIFSPVPMGSSHNRLLRGDLPPLPLSFNNNSRDQQLRDLPAPDKDDQRWFKWQISTVWGRNQNQHHGGLTLDPECLRAWAELSMKFKRQKCKNKTYHHRGTAGEEDVFYSN